MDAAPESKNPIGKEALVKRLKPQKTEREKVQYETPRQTLDRFAKKERSTQIASIEPIGVSIARIPNTREDLSEILELPVREPSLILYDLGIKTESSTGNKNNLSQGYASIEVSFDSLSDENKKILLENASHVIQEGEDEEYFDKPQKPEISVNLNPNRSYGNRRIASLKAPMFAESTAGDIEDKFMSLVDKFKPQEVTWMRKMTHEQVCEGLGSPQDITTQDLMEFGFYLAEDGYYYDSKGQYEYIEAHKKYKNPTGTQEKA